MKSAAGKRIGSTTLAGVLLALAPACSTSGSPPGSAQEAADDKRAPEAAPSGDAVATKEAEAEAAAAGARAPAPAPAPASSLREEARDDALASSRLKIGEPVISGGLDRDIIRRKAQDHQAELQACHARALAGQPELAGTLAVELDIDARGLVEDVKLAEGSELDDRELVDCILEQLASWSFAGEASEAASVELRLELAPAN